jgi:hypothetical protein
LHWDKLTELLVDPDVNKVLVYPQTLLARLFGYGLYSNTDGPHHLLIRFLGRAKRLFTESCLPASAISISDTENSPELNTSIAKLVQQVLRQSLFDITTSSSTPSTPLTRITTPTLQLSRDESPALTPATDPPVLHPLFQSKNGIPNPAPNLAPQRVMLRGGDGQLQLSRPIATAPATTPPSLLATHTQDTLRTNNLNSTNNSPFAPTSNAPTNQSAAPASSRFAPTMPLQSQQPTTQPTQDPPPNPTPP